MLRFFLSARKQTSPFFSSSVFSTPHHTHLNTHSRGPPALPKSLPVTTCGAPCPGRMGLIPNSPCSRASFQHYSQHRGKLPRVAEVWARPLHFLPYTFQGPSHGDVTERAVRLLPCCTAPGLRSRTAAQPASHSMGFSLQPAVSTSVGTHALPGSKPPQTKRHIQERLQTSEKNQNIQSKNRQLKRGQFIKKCAPHYFQSSKKETETAGWRACRGASQKSDRETFTKNLNHHKIHS